MVNEFLKGTLAHIYSLRYHFIFITVIFFIAAATGYLYGAADETYSDAIIEELGEEFSGLVEQSPPMIVFNIFTRNTALSFMALVSGIAFGLIPLGFITINGILIGVIMQMAEEEMGALFVLLAIIPHGIVELPMVILSSAIGMKLGQELLCILIDRESNIKEEFIKGIRTFTVLVVPLLFVAAIIEVYITSTIVYILMNMA
ncbi:MAG: stage II sporulation protein M [Halobacteriota archaeon]|nr:stage II sporulation protein M [Halobacteriota archaeon]